MKRFVVIAIGPDKPQAFDNLEEAETLFHVLARKWDNVVVLDNELVEIVTNSYDW